MFKTISYTIHSDRIPVEFDGLCLVHLSDLHGKIYGKNNEYLLQGIHRVSPDCVIMTGDMAAQAGRGDERAEEENTHRAAHIRSREHIRREDDAKAGVAIERMVELCRGLSGHYPVYYAIGNHEQSMRSKVLARLYSELRKLGVTVLENDCCRYFRHGAFVKIYGLVPPKVYDKELLEKRRRRVCFSAEDVSCLLGTPDPSCYNLLLAHNPLFFPAYRDWGADLTLSGHIHGGIIRIPGMGGLLSPDISFFPKYDGGHFEEEGRHLIVSRGLSNHFLFRINNPPELVTVTLNPHARGSGGTTTRCRSGGRIWHT